MSARPTSPVAQASPRSGRDLFALGVVAIVNVLFLLNNLAPYLGLQYSGAMTMFSNLSATADNHVIMPKVSLSDADTYVSVQRVEMTAPSERSRQFEAYVAWADQRRVLTNLNFVRYHLNRLCAEVPDRRIGIELVARGGQRSSHPDACAEPDLLRYFGLSSYDECLPECEAYLRQWARRETRAR